MPSFPKKEKQNPIDPKAQSNKSSRLAEDNTSGHSHSPHAHRGIKHLYKAQLGKTTQEHRR